MERRGGLRGMTLVEVMVVIAIIVMVLGAAVPSLALMLDIRQKQAVQQLASTYAFLRDEATIRNVTFRMAYNVDRQTWKVEVGSPDATIFTSAEEREQWERDLDDKLSRYTKREIEEGVAAQELGTESRFEGITDVQLDTEKELPGGSHFAWAWTPQYREPVTPSAELPEDPAEDRIVYSYIFPDGQMEFTALSIVGDSDSEDGYTLIVEPLTGRIHVENADINWESLYSWLPAEGPELPQ